VQLTEVGLLMINAPCVDLSDMKNIFDKKEWASFPFIVLAISLAFGSAYGEIISARSSRPLAEKFHVGWRSRPPDIISRTQWGAKQALPGMKPQLVKGIILHNTGIRKNPNASLERKMRGLQSFSQNPGEVSPGHMKPSWPDIPYHYYVDFEGKIAEGRDTKFAGDSNTNYNTSGFLQIVVEGDFERESPSSEQLSALRDLLTWIIYSRRLTVESISVHKDYASTDCPGRNFMVVLPKLLSKVKEKLTLVSSD
jgi:hypothetical protein